MQRGDRLETVGWSSAGFISGYVLCGPTRLIVPIRRNIICSVRRAAGTVEGMLPSDGMPMLYRAIATSVAGRRQHAAHG